MLNREFICWVGGFVELSLICGDKFELSTDQRRIILAHAKLCQEVCKDEIILFVDFILHFVMNEEKCESTFFLKSVYREFEKLNDVLTCNELCYYMQGYFEIGQTQTWTRSCLTRLIYLCEKNQSGLIKDLRIEYCRWREAYAAAVTEYNCEKWKSLLNSIFLHSIDNSYGAQDQEKLDKIHKS